jgi:thiamine-phosphate pyrophosphorylase
MPDSAVLRLLDAASNRAREALRVLEDYARFVLDDAALSTRLKQMRHALSVSSFPDAVLHRDTPGDVGTTAKLPDELARADAAAVVIAAGKRLGEALRSIEEYSKIDDPRQAVAVEKLRYEFYEIERRLNLVARPRERFCAVRLYVVVSESICRLPWMDVCAAAISGGADCIQLREKGLSDAEMLKRSRWLAGICRERGILSIINDRPDVAVLAGADGVHLGQDDLPAEQARKIVGNRLLVGLSTHQIEQAKAALAAGVDYIGVGPFFPSYTKPRDFLPGSDYARQVAAWNGLPAVAIAGITAANVDQVLATGLRAVAVSSAVCSAPDPAAAAATIKRRMEPAAATQSPAVLS